MTQCEFHEIIPAKPPEFVGIAIQRKCSLNPFRKNPQQFAACENAVRTFLEGHYPAKFSHEVSDKWELQQSGMGEETDQSSRFLRDQMHGHHAIPRHKPAVSSNQHSSPLAGDVLHAFHFNPPVTVA